MPRKEYLFRLIKSLTKSEKRYFKVFASRHTIGDKNNYLNLFEVIDRQKEYDEEAVIKLLCGTSLARFFAASKHYLYKIIIKSLAAYHTGSSIDAELQELLHTIEILFNKGLYGDCENLLAKTKDIAGKYEKNLILLELGKWENKLMTLRSYTSLSEKKLADLLKERLGFLEKEKNVIELKFLNIKFDVLFQSLGMPRDEKGLQKYEYIMNNTLLHSEEKALSITARNIFHHIHYLHFFVKGDLKNAHSHIKKRMMVLESNPDFGSEDPTRYIAALNNYIVSCGSINNYQEAFANIKKLRTIKVDSINNQAHLFATSYVIEAGLYNTLGRFQECISLGVKVEEGLEKYRGKIPANHEIPLCFQMATAFLGTSNYRKSFFWTNKILNNQTHEATQDLRSLAKILNLFIHYEIENFETLPYFVKSTYRFLHRRDLLFKFENIILEFIRKQLPKIITPQNTIEEFRKLRVKLLPLMDDSLEKIPFEHFDFISWIESKTENRPFAEIVSEKAQKILEKN